MSGPVLGLLLCAFVVEFSTGGLARSVSPVPGDATFRRIARATWWAAPLLVTLAAGAAAWELRDRALLPAICVLVLTVLGVALFWRWRPQRAGALRLPRWIASARAAVRVQIRDAAAWRRQLVAVMVGVVALATTTVLR